MNSRNRIHVRWTVNPSALGYGGDIESATKAFRSGEPDFTSTPRQVYEYYRDLKWRMGGTFFRIEMRMASTGKVVTIADIVEAIPA